MEKITRRAMDLAKCYGAGVVGVVTTEMLEGGPPSTNLGYVLPGAKSAISFAVPLNQDYIESWFNKQSHADHLQNNIQANVLMPGDRVELTCGNCQLICHPDKDIRKQRYKLLVESGVVVENSAGSREAVSPADAKERLAKMDTASRALYEEA
jgi:hypothetical protein